MMMMPRAMVLSARLLVPGYWRVCSHLVASAWLTVSCLLVSS